MKLRLLGKAVRSPTFTNERWTREVLENRLQMVPGFSIAAETVILIERGVKRTAPTLVAVLARLASVPFIGPAPRI